MAAQHDIVSTLSPDSLGRAADLIREGALVASPTETVYGLGADATSPDAAARIYAAKGRPQFNPLIAHVASREAAEAEALFAPEAARLASAFWPGPLTLVLPRAASGTVCDLACAGLTSVGVRIPAHPVALVLLRAVGRPVAAPSANRSGRLSPTSAAHVAAELSGHVDLILDGGPCSIGVESTIVACLDGQVRVLRPGGIAIEDLEAALGQPLATGTAGAVVAPGMLVSHYAPRAALRLHAENLMPDEAGLDFGGRFAAPSLDLSPAGDLREAAANLFRHLRTLDARGPRRIGVAPVPSIGLGAAINDRLRRAAAPRPAAT